MMLAPGQKAEPVNSDPYSTRVKGESLTHRPGQRAESVNSDPYTTRVKGHTFPDRPGQGAVAEMRTPLKAEEASQAKVSPTVFSHTLCPDVSWTTAWADPDWMSLE